MPNIVPSSDLRNRYNEISDFCHQNEEPVFITKNGQGDLAVMSMATYERLTGQLELYRLLETGFQDAQAGNLISLDKAFSSILEEEREG